MDGFIPIENTGCPSCQCISLSHPRLNNTECNLYHTGHSAYCNWHHCYVGLLRLITCQFVNSGLPIFSYPKDIKHSLIRLCIRSKQQEHQCKPNQSDKRPVLSRRVTLLCFVSLSKHIPQIPPFFSHGEYSLFQAITYTKTLI